MKVKTTKQKNRNPKTKVSTGNASPTFIWLGAT